MGTTETNSENQSVSQREITSGTSPSALFPLCLANGSPDLRSHNTICYNEIQMTFWHCGSTVKGCAYFPLCDKPTRRSDIPDPEHRMANIPILLLSFSSLWKQRVCPLLTTINNYFSLRVASPFNITDRKNLVSRKPQYLTYPFYSLTYMPGTVCGIRNTKFNNA